MPGDPRAIVESGYDQIAERYADAIRAGRGPETYFRSFLTRVLELVPDGGRVLALARRNAPGARLVRADMVDLAFARRSFDAAVAFWTLIHVPRDAHASLLARIRSWLRPGGLFAGTLGRGDNPADLVPDFYGAPMYWSHFDAETNRALLRAAGFDLVQADEIQDEGETPLWVIATA